MGSIEVDTSVVIDAPPETVWEFVSDPSRYPEWSVVTERMTALEDGPLAEGSGYSEFGGLGPMTGESDWVVTEFDSPTRQVHEGDDGTVRTVMTIELTPTDGGETTRLDQSIEMIFPRGLRLLARILGALFLGGMAAETIEETARNAKRIIEDGRPH